ncbi:hypothetical protein [Ornithobacterium rhinotracheale]|uniref:hypothetical protein n=2 Tax=Ornithobacterium rhinotracheale TaxID=28251 RepID=UPI003FD1E3FF
MSKIDIIDTLSEVSEEIMSDPNSRRYAQEWMLRNFGGFKPEVRTSTDVRKQELLLKLAQNLDQVELSTLEELASGRFQKCDT